MDNVTITVIAVTENGQEKYVGAESCLHPAATVYHPANAINYSTASEIDVRRALSNIAVKGDDFWAKSGVRSETLPHLVEFEISVAEVSRAKGRDFHRSTVVEAQR